jgi:hypothetical protein
LCQCTQSRDEAETLEFLGVAIWDEGSAIPENYPGRAFPIESRGPLDAGISDNYYLVPKWQLQRRR